MKIALHPLFLLAGVVAAIFGGLAPFIICALTALLHECGHIFCAARLGYECRGVKLMPYGAAAMCEIDGIDARDEISLALAGPLVNSLICVICAGLWWFFPETYGFTDLIFYANAAMFSVNLLPAYPFDGGRIVRRLLLKAMPAKYADLVLRGLNLLCVLCLVLIFALVVRNFSLLALAGLLLCSAFEKNIKYRKIASLSRPKKRGREIKYVILDKDATFRDAFKFIDGDRYVIMQFYGDDFIDEITEDELYKRVEEEGKNLYSKIL